LILLTGLLLERQVSKKLKMGILKVLQECAFEKSKKIHDFLSHELF